LSPGSQSGEDQILGSGVNEGNSDDDSDRAERPDSDQGEERGGIAAATRPM